MNTNRALLFVGCILASSAAYSLCPSPIGIFEEIGDRKITINAYNGNDDLLTFQSPENGGTLTFIRRKKLP